MVIPFGQTKHFHRYSDSPPDEQTVHHLAKLADTHKENLPTLSLSVERMARRIATRKVLERLPDALVEVASCFDAQAGAA